MKKWLISLVLFFSPFYASAASLTIDNPVISKGYVIAVSGQLSQYYFAFEQAPSELVKLTLDVALVDMTFEPVNLKVTTYLQNWSLSLLDMASGFSVPLITNSTLATHHLNLVLSLASEYQFVFTGIAPLRHFSVEIAEAPLPAAVWLFGSMLLGGLAMKRRKAKQAQFAV